VKVRFGRMVLEDTYGPENTDLVVPLRTEYFNGSQYVLNTQDSCTAWDNSNAFVDSLSAVQAGDGTLSAGSSGTDGVILEAPTSVPGTPDTGDVIVTYDAPAWLEGDYDGNGSNEDPTATATFGVYRGHERLIFKREVR